MDRRTRGEPLAWITGTFLFAGVRLRLEPGIYVPRQQTELLTARAVARLPDSGLAVDLCTGCGAVAAALVRGRPGARVLATDIDPVACRCAASNGVEVYLGDLDEPVPPEVRGRANVVTAVVPYVPTRYMDYLPRDVREWEPRLALDGGPAGTSVLGPAVRAAARLLTPGGTLFLELGAGQPEVLRSLLVRAGFGPFTTWTDEDGDLRGLEARFGPIRAR